MKIRTEIDLLKEQDIYSLMLFALYKAKDLPEYAALSELAYILDKESLLKLCEFYGGLTIRIPTVSELEKILYALFMYQEVDLENKDFDKVYEAFREKDIDANHVKDAYYLIKELLKDYKFNTGKGKDNVT